jgi:hypothetical protein
VAQYMPVAHVEIRKGRRSTYKLAQFDVMSICIDEIVSCDYYVCGQRPWLLENKCFRERERERK